MKRRDADPRSPRHPQQPRSLDDAELARIRGGCGCGGCGCSCCGAGSGDGGAFVPQTDPTQVTP